MNAARMLIARVGAEYFAFPLASVLEALDGAAIAPLPLVPRGVLGQCVHRGSLLPVLDPQVVLGSPAVRQAGTVLVFVAAEPFALAVDDVTDMLAMDDSARRAMPAGTDRGGLIAGLFTAGGLLVSAVDLEALRSVAASLLSPQTR